MNITTIAPQTLRHKVGTCPACRAYLWAEVDVAVTVSEPTMNEAGQARVYANPSIVAMRVAHSCWTDDDGERRQELDTSEVGDLGDLAQAWDDGYRACFEGELGERNPHRSATEETP